MEDYTSLLSMDGVPVRMAIILISFPEIRHSILNDAILLDEIAQYSSKINNSGFP